MSVLGIDLGSSNCVLATVGRGAVSIVRNEISERLTPSLVVFTENERLIGESALSQLKSNYKNACHSFKNLLGRSATDPELNHEKKYAYSSLVSSDNGTIGYQVMYKGQTRVLNPAVVTGALLAKLKTVAEKATGVSAVDIVIACPGWFTDSNRQALLAATEIAGLNCRKILSEHTATALDYGIFRSRDFDEKIPQYVSFVSVGHANSSVSIVEFVKGSLKVIKEVSYRDLGGRDMDLVIAQHFANIFEKQHNIQPMKIAKAKFKLEDQASRIKKVLSANAEAQFHVECLVEDYDCNGFITRNEFEELCTQSIIPRFQKLLSDAFENSGVDVKDIHAIEVIGGCTRIPWLQNIIYNFFGKTPSKTLSSDECVARGCALQAAMCSSAYRVREFSCLERTFFPISVGWSEDVPSLPENDNSSNDNNKNQSAAKSTEKSVVVVECNMFSNTVKKLMFDRSSSFDVWAYYSDPKTLPVGAVTQLCNCHILLPADPQCSVKTIAVRCKLDSHGIFKFDKAELIEIEEFEEIVKEKRPVQKPASNGLPATPDANNAPSNDGQPSNEATANDDASTQESQSAKDNSKTKNNEVMEEVQVRRKSKRTKKTELQIIITENPINFTKRQVAAFREEEINMSNEDKILAETKEKMNELEAYIYSMRDKVKGSLNPFVKPENMNDILTVFEEAENWLYDNVHQQKSVFSQKLNELQAYGYPIVKRYEQNEKRNECINNAFRCIQHQRMFATNPDKKYFHITDGDRHKIINETNIFESWLNDMMNKQRSIPLYEDNNSFTAEMINERIEALCNFTNQIMSKPKASPPLAAKQQENEKVLNIEVEDANSMAKDPSTRNNCNNDSNFVNQNSQQQN